VIGAAYKQAIVTLVECKSCYALIAKVSNKISDLVSQAIITKLNAVTALKSTTYFSDPFASWQGNADQTQTSMTYCVNTSKKNRPL
jgi:IS30 family transposase